MTTVLTVLTRARDLLADPAHWTKGELARSTRHVQSLIESVSGPDHLMKCGCQFSDDENANSAFEIQIIHHVAWTSKHIGLAPDSQESTRSLWTDLATPVAQIPHIESGDPCESVYGPILHPAASPARRMAPDALPISPAASGASRAQLSWAITR